MTAGAQGVQQSPGQAAAAASASYLAGVQANVSKFQQNSAAVSTQQWQQAYITKGIPRVASGATAAVPKVASFQAQLQPFQQSLKSNLPARGPAGSNDARMLAWSAGMKQFKKNPGT